MDEAGRVLPPNPGEYLEDHQFVQVASNFSNPPFISHLGHLEGEQPYLGDLSTHGY